MDLALQMVSTTILKFHITNQLAGGHTTHVLISNGLYVKYLRHQNGFVVATSHPITATIHRETTSLGLHRYTIFGQTK